MKLSKLVLYSAGAFVAVAAIGALTSPKLAAAIRAAYVEVVVPSQPFHASAILTNAGMIAIGASTGTLGVTNITLTNKGTEANDVELYPSSFGGPNNTCVVPSTTDITNQTVVIVQPNSTLVVSFPTPWVFVAGQTCIGAQLNGGSKVFSTAQIIVNVTGFVN